MPKKRQLEVYKLAGQPRADLSDACKEPSGIEEKKSTDKSYKNGIYSEKTLWDPDAGGS